MVTSVNLLLRLFPPKIDIYLIIFFFLCQMNIQIFQTNAVYNAAVEISTYSTPIHMSKFGQSN